MRRVAIRLGLSALMAISLAPTSVAADLFVATTGSDANDCRTAATPCLTLGGAVALASAGDAIFLAAGTYLQNLRVRTPVRIVGAGRTLTVLQGAPGDFNPVLDLAADGPCAVSSLTVTGGAGPGLWAGAGAGVFTLTDLLVERNANAGFTHGCGTAFLLDSWVQDNAASGIVNFCGTLRVTNCDVLRNLQGGIVIDTAPVYLDRCRVNDNVTPLGGGAVNAGFAPIDIVDSTLSGNRSSLDGGAILSFAAGVVVRRSTLTGNHANGNGGAIALRATGPVPGILTVTNSTLSANSADGRGGALHVGADRRGTLASVTLSENRAQIAGGASFTEPAATLEVWNSILAGNLAPSGPECGGPLVSRGYNLLADAAGCTVTGDVTGNVSGPALLAPLGGYGGPAFTHALLPGSVAIDAGNPAGCLDEAGMPLLADERGWLRPISCGGLPARCDMGAFEGCGLPPAIVLYESALASLVVDPGNAVATPATSPFDHASSAVAPLLFYQLDDGSGNPPLLRAVKQGSAVRFFF